MLTADPDSRLSDGVVIETRLRARLFGAPVLKVDGLVLVSPARVDLPERRPRVVAAEQDGDREVPGVALTRAARLLEQSRASLGGRG